MARLPWSGSTANAPHSPIALPDGQLLFVGYRQGSCGESLTDAAFLMDLATRTVSRAPDLPHYPSTADALPDGRVLMAGRWHAMQPECSGELVSHPWLATYDPITGAADPPFDHDRWYQASAKLQDGRVALIEEGQALRLALRAGVDLVALQPYLLKSGEASVKRGTLDLKAHAKASRQRLHGRRGQSARTWGRASSARARSSRTTTSGSHRPGT